jgi:translation elongation factor EF-4
MELHDRADAVTSDDYPTQKALSGLKEKRPRFYRGLDPDGVDDYREFASLADVRRVEWLLTQVAAL